MGSAANNDLFSKLENGTVSKVLNISTAPKMVSDVHIRSGGYVQWHVPTWMALTRWRREAGVPSGPAPARPLDT